MNKAAPPREKSDVGLKQPFYTKRVAKTSNTGASRLDAKSFDQKLVDRAFGAIFELQKIYQFAIVKCQARPFMRKAADLQEEVMLKGLDSNAVPRSYQPQVNFNSEDASNSQLAGYGQLVLEA